MNILVHGQSRIEHGQIRKVSSKSVLCDDYLQNKRSNVHIKQKKKIEKKKKKFKNFQKKKNFRKFQKKKSKI